MSITDRSPTCRSTSTSRRPPRRAAVSWSATASGHLPRRAGVVGPLIEVPVLVALVYVSLAARRHWSRPTSQEPR